MINDSVNIQSLFQSTKYNSIYFLLDIKKGVIKPLNTFRIMFKILV